MHTLIDNNYCYCRVLLSAFEMQRQSIEMKKGNKNKWLTPEKVLIKGSENLKYLYCMLVFFCLSYSVDADRFLYYRQINTVHSPLCSFVESNRMSSSHVSLQLFDHCVHRIVRDELLTNSNYFTRNSLVTNLIAMDYVDWFSC